MDKQKNTSRKETEEKIKRLMEDSIKCKSLEELTALFTTLGFTEAQGKELMTTSSIASLPFLHSTSETEASTQDDNPTAARLKRKLALRKQKEAPATASVTIAPALAPTQTEKLKVKKKLGAVTSMVEDALTSAAQITVPPASADDHPTQGSEQAEAETEADTTSLLKAIKSTLDMEEAVRLSQDFLAFSLGKFQREAGTEKAEELHDEKQPHELDRSDGSGNDGEH